MKLNRTVWIGGGAIALLLGLLTLIGLKMVWSSSLIPDAVQACLPQSGSTAKLWGVSKTDEGHYYLVGLLGHPYQEVLIHLNTKGQCRSLLPQDDPVLSHVIPLKLARDLALQRYSRVLKENSGRDAYQQQLTNYLHTAPEEYPSAYPTEYVGPWST